MDFRDYKVHGFFPDEWGAVDQTTPPILHKNKFPLSAQMGFKNPLLSSVSSVPLVRPERLPPNLDGKRMPGSTVLWNDYAPEYLCFVNSLAKDSICDIVNEEAEPLSVSVVFGTGRELLRHGLRFFVEMQPKPKALIGVPGIEPENPSGAGTRWGVGITLDMVGTLLFESLKSTSDCLVPPRIPFRINALGAFSTGVHGLVGTIRNKLIDLATIDRVSFYDCLFDKSGATLDAITILQAANHSVRCVAYVSTESDNTFKKNPASVGNLSVTHPSLRTVDFLAALRKPYGNLCVTRVIDNGAREQFFRLNARLAPVHAALAGDPLTTPASTLPARGSVISDENVFLWVYGTVFSGTVTLRNWLTANKPNVDAHEKKYSEFVTLLWKHRLLGYRQVPGQEWHDMIMCEFAWEYLF